MTLRPSIFSLLVAISLVAVSTATLAQIGTPGQRWESLSPEEQEVIAERAWEHRTETRDQRADRRAAGRDYWESLSPEAQATAKSEVLEHAKSRRSRVTERRALMGEQVGEEQKAAHDERQDRRQQRRGERRDAVAGQESQP